MDFGISPFEEFANIHHKPAEATVHDALLSLLQGTTLRWEQA